MAAPSRSIVEQLADPATYPHQPARVEVKETHISWVFLAGDLVYKLKKPVKFDFLDFSTIELREQACREELRLNRRLAPNCYLDVVPITLREAKFVLGDASDPCDWLVQMRRLPIERTLDQVFARGELHPQDIDQLISVMASFYSGLAPCEVSGEKYLTRCLSHVRDNRKSLLAANHHIPATQVQRVHAAQLQTMLLKPELLTERAATQHLVEGHGDLRPEHICLTDPIQIFDCIEFSTDLRTLDKIDELAFLASECDHLGATWVGPQLKARYEALTNDFAPPALWNFYKSYRACVRAKIAALRAEQLLDQQREAAQGEARAYLTQAQQYLQSDVRPLYVVVGGLSGTGKSTLAREISERFGARLLRTDVIRQILYAGSRVEALVDKGVYEPAQRARVYDELLRQIGRLQDEQLPVVVDGTFQRVAPLQATYEQARHHQAIFLAVECTCPTPVALERIHRRQEQGQDASQADGTVYRQQQLAWEPWPASIPQCRVDTTQPLAQQLAQVIQALRAAR